VDPVIMGITKIVIFIYKIPTYHIIHISIFVIIFVVEIIRITNLT